MEEILLEVSLILILILLNGFFAAAEIAVISARRGRLQVLASEGHPGAQRVLALQQDPSRFLSTVQIGVTLVGALASAIGGASVVRFLEPRLAALPLPWSAAYVEAVAILLVVAVISYLSLVVGELVPKKLALRRAEALAMALSAPLDRLACLAHPLVWILTRSSDFVLQLVVGLSDLLSPAEKEKEAGVTDEEILAMLREGVAMGVFHPSEQALVQGVFRFADRRVQEVMRPRADITAVEASTPVAEVLELARQRGFSRYPVYEGDLDHIVGLVHVKDLLSDDDPQRPVRETVREPLLVPDSLRLIELLRQFQRAGTHLAIVLDEYGGTAGLVTLEDLLEEIVGDIEDEHPHPEPGLRRRPDGALIVPGTMPVHDLAQTLHLTILEHAPYDTVAGLILYLLGRIPRPGEEVTYAGYRLVVQEMEARRIKQVMIVPLAHKEGSSSLDGENPS
ncbi:MAG TPA: HlyC/CorC family transporter [Caldilineae bacterium]|nr:HlyC/CorC family transporter [Caldilineae bacterium]